MVGRSTAGSTTTRSMSGQRRALGRRARKVQAGPVPIRAPLCNGSVSKNSDTSEAISTAFDRNVRLLVESIQDYAIFMLDPNGYILSWNAGAERIKGYSANEIIGRHFSVFYPAEAVQRGHPEFELQVATETGRFEEEGWRVRRDGSLFWANVVITALYDAAGVLRGFGKVTRDLTRRRSQEESLRQSEERFRLLVEGVSDYAILMLDPNGYIATWNTGAQRIIGYEPARIIGRHFSVFYPPDAVESGWPEHELQVATAQGRFEEQGWRLRSDGTQFWASVVITALRDEAGRLRGFAKLTRDLTERRRAEVMAADGARRDELLEAERRARIEAQRAARMKDEFLATLSHELRTPLNAILGWTQILRRLRTEAEPDLEHGLEIIERNARMQIQLVDDLLDLSRIMSGRFRLDLQPLEAADVLRSALESARPAAEAKGIRLQGEIAPEPGTIAADPGRLQQVLCNLLGNAIKFTPRGGSITATLKQVDDQVELTVSDSGVGIPAQFLPHVFDRFSQQDSTASRSYSGLGLGLAIAKQLVELHGGSIHAKSDGEGRGATFVVNLPRAAAPPAPDSAQDDDAEASGGAALPRLDRLSVLIVEDEPDARELVGRILECHGARVTLAASAEEALRILDVSAPDVLVSDIGMPGMDGYQLMRRIRSTEPKGKRLPALALTAFARAEDRKRVMLAGYQSHLAKPFDVNELVLLVSSLADRRIELG
jgi:PAS domain S-box-containing protein